MLRIGDFSRLGRVSVKTLRYYDQIGLLKPAQVDRFTSYRHYSVSQLPRLNRILALKDLGLSLEQIGQLLDDGLPAAQLRGMLRLKQADIQGRVRGEQARLARVEARLKQIEQENMMSNYDVVIKKMEPITVAGVRDVIPTYADIGGLFGEVESYVAQHGLKPTGACMAIYYDDEYRERDVDAEAAFPIASGVSAPASERVKVHQLPGYEEMACTIHQGSYDGLMGAYQALMKWIEVNGYRIIAPCREVYLRAMSSSKPSPDYDQAHQAADPSEYITEIQMPVEKVG